MAEDTDETLGFLIVGIGPRAGALAVRDRLLIEEDAIPATLAGLQQAGLEQAMLVATCDRTEVYAVAQDRDAAAASILGILARYAGLTSEALCREISIKSGEDAIRHLFVVAASLDSMVVGEPHILGQIKSALHLARASGLMGSELETILKAAFSAAKRVRSQTAIGTRPVSIARAAVELACGVHGSLTRRRGLLVGTGEMGELMMQALLNAGLSEAFVTDPEPLRAEHLAQSLDCHVLGYEELATWLPEADIVVTALGSRRCAITHALVRDALRVRRQQPVVIVDTAVPGDVEASVDRLEAAFRYDVDDLERIARDGQASRNAEAAAALRLIDEEVGAFLLALKQREAIDVLVALRRHFELTRDAALADAAGDAGKATRLLINRLLHTPIATMKAVAADSGDASSDLAALQRAVDRLFRLGRFGSENEE